MDFEFDALKPEYKELVPKYEEDFYSLHPNGNDEEKYRYIKKRILIKARTLLDCHEINLILKAKSFTPLDLIMAHKSCVERGVDIDYYKQIEFYFVNARLVLDIGCGLNPIAILERFPNIYSYYCIDKNKKVIELLNYVSKKYYCGKLKVYYSDLKEIPNEISQQYFDFVLVQKLIPQLTYDNMRYALNAISNIKARNYFFSASKKSLSRSMNIENKEEYALEKFIYQYGFIKGASFDRDNEFGYIAFKNEILH